MSRTLRPLAALAVLAVVVAGCGNGSASSSSSTAAGHTSTATTREKGVRFAECMRANGVSASRFLTQEKAQLVNQLLLDLLANDRYKPWRRSDAPGALDSTQATGPASGRIRRHQ